MRPRYLLNKLVIKLKLVVWQFRACKATTKCVINKWTSIRLINLSKVKYHKIHWNLTFKMGEINSFNDSILIQWIMKMIPYSNHLFSALRINNQNWWEMTELNSIQVNVKYSVQRTIKLKQLILLKIDHPCWIQINQLLDCVKLMHLCSNCLMRETWLTILDIEGQAPILKFFKTFQ